MKILIRKAQVIDANSSFDGQNIDLLIEDGTIRNIAENIQETVDETIEGEKLFIAPGFVDIKADFCDPGYEHKETITSGLDAAAYGGYAHVGLVPSTDPVIDNKSGVEYVLRQSEGHPTQLHPLGAVTIGLKGENLAQLYDLFNSGVRLFTDDLTPMSSGILYRALLYTKNFGGRVSTVASDASMTKNVQVNEGEASIHTGLKGAPAVAEWIEIERNIRLLSYTGGSIHFSGISTEESVRLIRQAKKDGMDITADVHFANLMFNEQSVLDFDTNFKVFPVLRSAEDQKALWRAIEDGTIDAIASDHRPNDQEEKELEFDQANFGMISLQTLFSALTSHPESKLETICSILGERSRKVLDIPASTIEVGQKIDVTLFQEKDWTFSTDQIISAVKNTPLIDASFQYQIKGILRGGYMMMH